MTSVSAVFAELFENAPRAPGRAYRSFGDANGALLKAFVDGTSRLPGIAFRAPRADMPAGFMLPKMKGALVSNVPDAAGPDAVMTLEISAAAGAFVAVFVELASSLVEDALAASTGREAFLLVARRLAAWARFFDGRAAGAMS